MVSPLSIHRRSRHLPAALALIASASLAACGGGGGDNGGPTDPPDPAVATSITVTPSTVAAVAGDTTNLTARVVDQRGQTMGGATVSWASSDPTTATVDGNGRMIALKGGNVTVTATSGSASGTSTVSVEDRVLSGAALTATSNLFLTGDQETLQAGGVDQRGRPFGNATVQFSSSNPAVATVDGNGQVTAVAPGSTTITAVISLPNPSSPNSSLGMVSGTDQTKTLVIDVATGSGVRVAGAGALDRSIVDYLNSANVPGAAVAVTKNGKLVYARGFGVADVANGRQVMPDSRFRYASISKPIAGVVALRLIEQGRMALTDRPFQVLSSTYPPLPGETRDARLDDITLEQILRHQAGWNPNRDVDNRIWEGVWRDGVRSAGGLFRYGLGVALHATPGTVHAYTNYDTQALARYIEHVTGQSFEAFAKSEVLVPSGATGVLYGKTGYHRQPADEVRYHDENGLVSSTLDADNGALEYSEASGQWTGSTIDLLRFARAVDGDGTGALLNQASQDLLESRDSTLWPNDNYFAGLHWYVRKDGTGYTWLHDGQHDGHFSRLVKRADGLTFAFFINRRLPTGQTLLDIEPVLNQITFPDHDLFGMY